MKRTFTAWAVRWKYPTGLEPFFAGRFFFGPACYNEGCMTRLFETRWQAREACQHQARPSGRGVAVKVRVTVEC